jgi:Na+/H+-dicarboxylate symporter
MDRGDRSTARRHLNGFSVASVALGVAWLLGMSSVFALVIGLVALREVRRTGDAGRELALLGITLGVVGIAAGVVLGSVRYVGGRVVRHEFSATCQEVSGPGAGTPVACG